MKINTFIILLVLIPSLFLSEKSWADWQHTLYGSLPADCSKINANEREVFKCREEANLPTDVQRQFNQLDQFLEEDKEAQIDARYEIALLRKLADTRGADILEAISEFSILENDTAFNIKKIYQSLPQKCIQSFPKLQKLNQSHLQTLNQLSNEQISAMQFTRNQALIEDLSYCAQLRASKNQLMQKRQERSTTKEQFDQINQTIKAIEQMLETISLKDPLLSTEALKAFERHPNFRLILEDPDRASSSIELQKEIQKRMKQGASELRKKLSNSEKTGLGYLCEKMQGNLEDLVYHRFARGVKEADFIDSLLSQEDELKTLTDHRAHKKDGMSKEDQIKNIAYYGLMGSAACRLQLKVINNTTVDLAREFVINAGLTIGTAGLSSVATGLTVGSKVIVAANTGRTGRIALAGISALDLGTAATIEAPQVYENCIKGNVNQDRYFINSEITPLSCGISIGMASISRTMGLMGLRNTVRAFKNDKINAAYLSAMKGNIAAQSDIKLQAAYKTADSQVAKMTSDEVIAKASSIAKTKVPDLVTARVIVRYQKMVESLPVEQQETMLKLTLQGKGQITPLGKVPLRVKEAIEQSPNLTQSKNIEAIEDAVSGTSLPSSTADDIVLQGHMGRVLERHEELRLIKSKIDTKFRFSDLIDDHKSEKFLRLFKGNSDARNKALFFNVENTVQKQLNDLYIVDKEVVDALNDHYKRLLYLEIKSNRNLNGALIGEFNDFKSLKLAFDKSKMSTNVLNSELNNIYKKVNNDFASYCNQLGIKNLLTKDGQQVKGMVGDPRHWYIAGTGDSVDMSSIFSRLARSNYQSGKNATLIGGKNYAKQLKSLASKTEELRSKAEGILKSSPNAMKNGILDEELVAILRKSGQKGYGDDYFSLVRSKVKAAYNGLDLSNEDISNLRSYYNAADTFSPPVLSATRVTHNLDAATGDIVSFDYRGVGALNGQANMRALKEWDGDNMEKLSQLIREHDNSVTNRLIDLREKATTQSIKQAFAEIEDTLPSWQKNNITYSGDDGILKIPAEVKAAYIQKFGTDGANRYQKALESIYDRSVTNLKSIGERADRVRITRLNAPEMKQFGQIELGEQISKQEGIEKGLRDYMLGKISSKEDIIISVESHIDAHGSITYRIINKNAENQDNIDKLINEYIVSNQIPLAHNLR